MIDEAVSRRRENAAFFLRILAFGLIFTLISCAVLYADAEIRLWAGQHDESAPSAAQHH